MTEYKKYLSKSRGQNIFSKIKQKKDDKDPQQVV